MANSIAIGIDLGTTNSCVGVWQNGRVDIIPNDSGNRTMPSVVAFTDTECLIGDSAKIQAFQNPDNTIFGVKRLIGRKLDESLLSDMEFLPYKVFCDGDKCKIAVTYRNEARAYTTEEISAKILAKLKEAAETYLDCAITDAVITVPAYFNDSQRKATIDAGRIAGLNVLRILNEPTAAALAYGLDKKISEDRNLLVFDLGGGTFDVSIMTVKNGDFKVKAVSGDTHLGGEDIDNRLLVYIMKDFQRKFQKFPGTDKRALSRMRKYCENAKIELSNQDAARIQIDALFDGTNYSTTITRSRFEEINKQLFELTLKTVEKALHGAQMNKTDIHDVVLVGGSTRIPKIRSILEEFFGGKKPNQGINPDEAVAYGAAIQAALLKSDSSPGLRGLHLTDVLSLSLGIETEGGTTHPLIKRNTQIPTKHTEIFPTCEDNQRQVGINVYEGEREMFKDNNNLGSFTLKGLPDGPKGAVKLDVTFEVDENGTLTVSATEKGGRATSKITIQTNQGRLSEQEIQRMTQEAERNKEEDKRQQECALKKVHFEDYIGTIESEIASNVFDMGEADKTIILSLCKEASKWLEQPHTVEEYTNKHTELRQIWDLTVQKLLKKKPNK